MLAKSEAITYFTHMENKDSTIGNDTIFNDEDFISQGYDKHLKQARNAIFVVAAIQFVVGIFIGYQGNKEERLFTIGLMTVISIIFLTLGIWANKKPYTAILSALILFGSLLALDAIFDPMSLLKGVIFKAIIIFYLFRGLKNAKEAQQMKELLKESRG